MGCTNSDDIAIKRLEQGQPDSPIISPQHGPLRNEKSNLTEFSPPPIKDESLHKASSPFRTAKDIQFENPLELVESNDDIRSSEILKKTEPDLKNIQLISPNTLTHIPISSGTPVAAMPHYSQSQRGFISEAGISNFVLPTDNTQNLQNLEGQDSNRTSIQPIQTRNNPIKIKKNNNLYNSFHGKGNLFSSSQHVAIGMWEECMINRDISNNLREQGYFSPLESQVALLKFANNSRPTNCYIATDIDSGKSLGIAISSANCINTKSAYIQCLLIGCSEDKCSILYKYAMQICLSTKGTVTMVKNIKEDCTIACTSHILIGTPQKLVALIDKFPSMLNKVARVYIDDANAILHVCEYQLKKIKSRLPSKCSTYILAQTDSSVPDASKLINGSIKIIQIKSTPCCFNRVKLFHILTDNKMGKLNQILSTTLITQAIIFANSGDTTQSISAALPSSVKYYKNRKPSENDESIKAFKSKAAKYLICTDILTSTRISDANVIISYDIPINPDNSLDETKYKQRILCTSCEHKCASVALLLTKSDELNYMKILRKMKLDSVAITSVDDIEDYLHS